MSECKFWEVRVGEGLDLAGFELRRGQTSRLVETTPRQKKRIDVRHGQAYAIAGGLQDKSNQQPCESELKHAFVIYDFFSVRVWPPGRISIHWFVNLWGLRRNRHLDVHGGVSKENPGPANVAVRGR